jgi:hypothetical protein
MNFNTNAKIITSVISLSTGPKQLAHFNVTEHLQVSA